MCDTFVALPSATVSGHVIFGKNSDREPNEAQAIVKIPRLKPTQSQLQTTYIRIPQVAETHAVVLSKPFQMWGAEMGVNEHGVVIGNEAIFTKVRFNKLNVGLTGMDLLRLALERASTAYQALEVITSLLGQYGQDASGGYENRGFYYHNSFIIADATSAWVLETAGREWAAERVVGVRSISNGLTIGESFDLSSPGLIDHARRRGWLRPYQTFHFAKHYSARFMTQMSQCHLRQATTTQQATVDQGLSAAAAMGVLQSHEPMPVTFAPQRSTNASVCMHATGLLTPNQTVGSLVAEIRPNAPATVWLTGTSAPCLSVFKPVVVDGQFLEDFTQPTAQADASFWWQAERLFRLGGWQHSTVASLLAADNQALQQSLLQQEATLIAQGASTAAFDELSAQAFFMHYNAIQIAIEQYATTPHRPEGLWPLYRWYWYGQNRKARLFS
jgi:dipeptidase